MANTSIILSNLDFDTHKNTLKAYLKSQDTFKDYDFEGSNMSVLLDILSYNTYHNAFYLNMIGNEMFMDSAQLRDSVVSHAKELNYTPRSFKSAQATVDMTFLSTDLTKRNVIIPKGQSFTSRFGTKNFTFTTGENIIVNDFTINGNNTITFSASDITLFEGYYVNDTFTFTADSSERFLISNKNVDTSSITVTVIEDSGATTLTYNRTTSLFDLNSTSKVFFVQGAENDLYEIMFGDGVSGRKPKDNSVIVIEYRVSNGELPNGCNTFTPDSNIDSITYSNIIVSTVTPASAGSVSESVESIKFNAPRYFTTQERAITTEDYENLLKLNYPEINAVTCYGGEDLDPPQYGRVFVTVDLNDVDGLPTSKRDEYYRFLRPRSPVSIEPVFVSPDYTYIAVDTTINYNINDTKLTNDDIKTIVSSAILKYAQTNLNTFNTTFRYSRLLNAIDSSQASIVSNQTTIKIIKILEPNINTRSIYTIDFAAPLTAISTRNINNTRYTITSSRFRFNDQTVTMRDDGLGVIQFVSSTGTIVNAKAGRVNYNTGVVRLSSVKIQNFTGEGIKIYAIPRSQDITTRNNVILNIVDEDIKLTVVPVRV